MIEINNTTQQKINESATRKLIQAFLKFYHREAWSVSLALIGPARMKSLNYAYRGIDRATDVLSFPESCAVQPVQGKYLGEVLINMAALKQIKEYQGLFTELLMMTKSGKELSGRQSSVKRRLGQEQYLFNFLLVHGLLHLIGYDDNQETKRRAMLQQGKKFLSRLGQELY